MIRVLVWSLVSTAMAVGVPTFAQSDPAAFDYEEGGSSSEVLVRMPMQGGLELVAMDESREFLRVELEPSLVRELAEKGVVEVLTLPPDGSESDAAEPGESEEVRAYDFAVIGLIDEYDDVYFIRVSRTVPFVAERVPVFLNTVNHATILYAGGPVVD